MAHPESKSGEINRYYLTLTNYSIDPRYLNEPGVTLGRGIDMSNPLQPILAPYTAFEAAQVLATPVQGLPKSSDEIRETTVFKESLTDREEANVLSTYFKASYQLVSVEGAYKTAKKEQTSYHTVYALAEHLGESENLPPMSSSLRKNSAF